MNSIKLCILGVLAVFAKAHLCVEAVCLLGWYLHARCLKKKDYEVQAGIISEYNWLKLTRDQNCSTDSAASFDGARTKVLRRGSDKGPSTGLGQRLLNMLKRTRSGRDASRIHQHVGQFADSTSDFRKIDILTLNVIYTETTNPDELCNPCDTSKLSIPSDVYVSDLSHTEIKSIIDDTALFDKLDNMTKTFVQIMNYVMINESQVRGTEESRTDAFVDLMLRRLKFGEYPLMMLPHKPSKLSVYTKNISSEPDFAIVKNSCIMLVDEDKHIRNTGPPSAWGEYQIAGELIASAYCNYSASKLQYKSLLYAVRVIGLKFTFYKAEITPEYLDSLGEGFPSESVTIRRYPGSEENKDFPHLDYTEASDRREIVDMLIRIREDIVQ